MRIHFLVIIHKIIQKKGDVKKMKDLEIFFKEEYHQKKQES